MEVLTVNEALIALADGKKITSDFHRDNHLSVKFIYQTAGGVHEDITNNIISAKSLTKLLRGENLRVYQEPKKMIKVAKYAYHNGVNFEETWSFYKSEKACMMAYSDDKLFIRLDYTEIEVDDY